MGLICYRRPNLEAWSANRPFRAPKRTEAPLFGGCRRSLSNPETVTEKKNCRNFYKSGSKRYEPMGEVCGLHKRRVRDAHSMVQLITLPQASQNAHCLWHAGLLHQHLYTSLQTYKAKEGQESKQLHVHSIGPPRLWSTIMIVLVQMYPTKVPSRPDKYVPAGSGAQGRGPFRCVGGTHQGWWRLCTAARPCPASA